ncbi:MAG TPA: pitrilysin family protein [Terriglobales bacterium]|nr:pitrilysin family protein [Terriglobales bacterium]
MPAKKLLRSYLYVLIALPVFSSFGWSQGATSKAAAKPAVQVATKVKTDSALPTIPYEKYKLKNGLDVILSEDHRLPLVAVNLWYHVGPANERPGRTGFAHLYEHMMFEGSKNVGAKAHFRYLEGAGASDINGTTEFDRTNYFETLPSNQLELALWLESDRMGYLLDTVDREKLANQRDVVRNERRQSIEGAPYGLAEEEVYHQLFPKGHPYYAYVMGSHADIEAARINDIREFFKQYYSPNNCSLAIVGDFDKAQTKALVEKYFGSIPAGPPVPKIQATTPPITSERRVTVTDQVELPRVYMAWLGTPIFKPGDAEADLLARILGGGKSSRLYKKLVYEKEIAQDVQASNSSLILGSVFEIQATAKPGVKPEELEKAINEEIENLRANGPTQAELERARNTTEAQMIHQLERLGGFGGVADRLNQYNHYLGDPGYLPKDLERYNQATAASVHEIASEELKPNARVVVYGVRGKKVVNDVPKTPAEQEEKESQGGPVVASNSPKEPWRANPPKPGPLSKLTLPTPESFTLPNGLTVMLVERHSLPIVSANLVVLAGSEANPPDKPGLASFTAAMLDEGTKKRPALKIAEDADQIGATIGTVPSVDSTSVTIRSLTKNADAAFELFSDVALDPAFDSKEIERLRSRRVTSVIQQKDEPSLTARRVMYHLLYGPGNPYGYVELGTEESNKAITRDEMVKFWQSQYTPANSALVITGDLTQEQARALATKYFGGWKSSGAKHQPVTVKNTLQRSIFVVDKPDAPQTELRIVTLSVARSNPDYVPLEVMNMALGGLFSSRINMNIREKHGYTYGGFSVFAYRRAVGHFVSGGSIRTDVTAPAVKEIFNEIEGIREAPISAEELAMAKGAIALSLPALFETSTVMAATVGQLFVYDLPLDYYQTLPAKIDAVTTADVQKVAQTWLVPESMVIVAVGDRAKIEPELKKLDLGTVAAVDYEGNPVKATAARAK